MAILVVALGVQFVLFGLPSNLWVAFPAGFAKALSWYFIAQTVRNHVPMSRLGGKCHLPFSQAQRVSWRVATAITTFGVLATRDPFMQTFEVQALLPVVASLVVLCQIVYMLPQRTTGGGRHFLWVLALAVLIPYLADLAAIRASQSSAARDFDRSHAHPVEELIRRARGDFEHRLRDQSASYASAQQEYQRRYAVEPPPGFQEWYEFAAASQSPIIDDFDTIFDAVAPFLRLSGREVARMMTDIQNTAEVDIWRCDFYGERGETRCRHPQRSSDRHISLLFNTLLGGIHGKIPSLRFLVNHLDEPRVLIPPATHTFGRTQAPGRLKTANLALQPTWDAITKFCSSTSSSTSTSQRATPAAQTGSAIVDTFGLPFVTDRSAAMDLCRHPEYSGMHGLFISPTSFRLVEGAVPILSTGSPSSMGDVLFPSPAYVESEFLYDEEHDVDWDVKLNKLYWAGSTTGGVASDGHWRQFHRQRFVALAQNLDWQQHAYLRQENDGRIVRTKSRFLNGRLFNVFFTRIFQCAWRSCRDEWAHFRIKAWADKDEALRSRLVFDVDGNGISGRYYKLLASRSVPLKQTLLREWHDDRLMPWVHFIPVSQSMEELPELIRFLTSTELGQQRAREIAEQGRAWYREAFREVDMTVYVYRLLLELARVQDPERKVLLSS